MKGMTLWSSVGAGIVAVNAVGWLVVHGGVDSGASATADDVVVAQPAEDRLVKLESQMGAVVARLEGLVDASARNESQREVPKLAAAHVAEAAKKSENSPLSETSEAASVVSGPVSGGPDDEQLQRERQRVAQLDYAISSDEVDTRSGQAAEMDIQGIFASGEWSSTQLVNAECRVSLCKFVVNAKTVREAQEFATTFPGRLGWASDSEVRISGQDSATGAVELTIFQSRDGQRLPTPNG